MTPENNSQQGAKYTFEDGLETKIFKDGKLFAVAYTESDAQQIIDGLNERAKLEDGIRYLIQTHKTSIDRHLCRWLVLGLEQLLTANQSEEFMSEEKPKCKTIDECCNEPEGTFAQWCKDHPDPDKYIAEIQAKYSESSPPPSPTHAGEHSPEPWKSVGLGYGIEDADGVMICETAQPHLSVSVEQSNARRIVDCVNFCAGVTNEKLAEFSLDERERFHKRYYEEKMAQLRTQLADLRQKLGESDAKAQWISVETRLPENHQRVLIRHGFQADAAVSIGSLVSGQWVSDSGRQFITSISHWQELPSTELRAILQKGKS